ncbi:MAG: hypothetical protein IKU37_05400 [Candidatus Gastranaerophilales bacterium]|nr:hypothetical protein [Candidatus Gastranaerophilales bacterium]
MLNLVDKKQTKNHNKLTFRQINDFYIGNVQGLIGLEYERLSLDKNTFENANYEKLEKIIKEFSAINRWELILDNETVIGAISDNGSSISLEPGCQLEISLAPKKDIIEIEIELFKIINKIDKIAALYDVIFLGYGISPKSCVDDIELLNKRRYKIMNDFLPMCQYGEFIPRMMRQSAGIQINVDYSDNIDAYYKLKFFNLIMPFVSALLSNSPFENGKLSDKKSIRNNVWRFCGRNRCNLFYKNIFNKTFAKKNVFKNYISCILDVPMIYIERNNEIIEIRGEITFREFMKKGYMGYFATFEDYILHQSLCFPDVRLKKYIEIRNHDSSDPKIALALCALYKGLCRCDILKLLSEFKFLKVYEIDNYAMSTITQGLDYSLTCNLNSWDVVQKIVNCAKDKLSTREIFYLDPIFEMLKLKETRADLLIASKINNISLFKKYINSSF